MVIQILDMLANIFSFNTLVFGYFQGFLRQNNQIACGFVLA